MQKTVLVTGAGGYIGRHVVSSLLDKGVHVIAVDLNNNGIDPRAQMISADIFEDDSDIYQKLGKPDVCLHMAWRNGFVHQSDSHIKDFPLHFRFIQNMLRGGLKQIAVMGTMHEIGYFEGEIDEDTVCTPTNLYGIAKDALRRCTMLLAKEENALFQWIRAYYIYGDDEFNHSIFSKILQAEAEGEEFFPLNSGKNQYDFISVTELASQIAAVVSQDHIGGIINCCTGKPVSLGEKVELFIQERNLTIRPQYGVFPDRPYDSPRIWGNSAKIARIVSGDFR